MAFSWKDVSVVFTVVLGLYLAGELHIVVKYEIRYTYIHMPPHMVQNGRAYLYICLKTEEKEATVR